MFLKGQFLWLSWLFPDPDFFLSNCNQGDCINGVYRYELPKYDERKSNSFGLNFADFFNVFLIFLTFGHLPDFPDHTALSRYSSIFPVYEMWEMRIAKGGGGFLNIVDIYLIKCSLFTVFSICHIVIQYIFHVFIWDA